MPMTQLRIRIEVRKTLYKDIRRLAEHDGVSISNKARSLLREALEVAKDDVLACLVEQRRLNSRKTYTLAEVKNKKRF